MTIFFCKTENLPDESMHATITSLVYTFAAMIFALGSLSSADGQEVGAVIFGSHGDGPGEFNDPAGIVVDPNGYLFVVDSLNNRIPGVCYIQISCCVIQCNAKGIIEFTWALSNLAPLTNKGSFVTEWGTSGNKNGQLSSPIGIDEDDAKQNVYVTDLGNNRVQRFTNNGIFVSTWGMIGSEAGQFNNPGRIAVDPSGNLFVADLGKSRIQKFDANGKLITMWGTLGSASGNLIVLLE